jgi:hypothetical protein
MSVTSRLSLRVFAPLLAVASGACAGSETGNGRKDGDPQEVWFQLGLDERPVASPLTLRDGGSASYHIEVAAGVVSRLVIHLDPGDCKADGVWHCGTNGDEGTVKVDGPFAVNLLGGSLVPQVLTPNGLSPDEIRSFSAKWGGGDEPTLDVRGTVLLDGETEARPFGLILDFEATTRFVVGGPASGEAAAEIGEDDASWRLALDASSWFEGVDLTACVEDGLVPTDAEGVLRLENASRWCRTLPAGIATGFRLDGVAKVFE